MRIRAAGFTQLPAIPLAFAGPDQLLSRNVRWIWPAATLVTVGIALIGGLLLYADGAAKLANLKSENAGVQSQLKSANSRIDQLSADNSSLASQAAHPTVSTWNDCGGTCTLAGNAYEVGSVPDTFTFHVELTASAPVSVGILTFREFETFDSCPTNHSVSSAGESIQAECLRLALNGAPRGWIGTNLNFDFHDAEGCAGYAMVIVAQAPQTVTLKPNVSVTYNPAAKATGVCA